MQRMKHQRSVLAICLLGLAIAPSGLAATLPSANLKALSDAKCQHPAIQLPAGGTYRFMAIGFNPARQALLEDALHKAIELEKRHPSRVEAIEIPVVSSGYQSAAPAIKRFMKGKVADKGLLCRVYPFFTDVDRLRQLLAIPASVEWVFLLANPQGRVVWKSQKPLSAQDISQLDKLIASPAGKSSP
jgi:hypothetical protein